MPPLNFDDLLLAFSIGRCLIDVYVPIPLFSSTTHQCQIMMITMLRFVCWGNLLQLLRPLVNIFANI